MQGDVGSGKTAVAFLALMAAVGGGHQGALMAPTEVLATQHAASLTAFLDRLPPAELPGGRRPTCALITGGVSRGEALCRLMLSLRLDYTSVASGCIVGGVTVNLTTDESCVSHQPHTADSL